MSVSLSIITWYLTGSSLVVAGCLATPAYRKGAPTYRHACSSIALRNRARVMAQACLARSWRSSSIPQGSEVCVNARSSASRQARSSRSPSGAERISAQMAASNATSCPMTSASAASCRSRGDEASIAGAPRQSIAREWPRRSRASAFSSTPDSLISPVCMGTP